MDVRPALAGELPQVFQMVARASEELLDKHSTPSFAWVITAQIEACHKRGQPVWVADSGRGRNEPYLMGYCAWVQPESVPFGMVVGLGTWVAPAFRHRGLSGRMREKAAEWWRNNGGVFVIGTAAVGNEAALASVKKQGFVVTGHEVRLDL